MVQHKSKVSTSKDTSSPSDSHIPTNPVTPKLVSAETVLEKLQRQDGGFYVGTQNLTPRVKFFQGGREGDVLIPKHTSGGNERTLRGVFQISRADFYFTPDGNFNPANVFNGRFSDVKLSCHLTASRHNDFGFSLDDFTTVIDNLRGFEKLIRQQHDTESLSAVHTALGIDSIKLVHHLFTPVSYYSHFSIGTLKTSSLVEIN
jgi:hypothetical protein